MASIDKRPNGQWRARWREYPGGPQRTRAFAKKIDAERWLVQVQHDLMTGAYVDPRRAQTPLSKYAEAWLQRMTTSWRPSTAASVSVSVRKHIVPSLGGRALGALRRSDIEAWAKGLELAPSTVATVRQHLGQILSSAVEDGLIARNPAAGARMPRNDAPRPEPVPHTVIDEITAALPAWARVIVPIGLGAGLRQGEVTGLTVDRVQFLRRQLRVDRQLATTSSAAPALAPVKTGPSNRTIPLAQFVADAIAGHVAEHGTGEHGLVVHLPDGRPIGRNRFGRIWRAARSAAGAEHVDFHDLRHTFASTLLSEGVSVKAVADWLGHASPTVTLSTYAHLMPVDEVRARTVLDEVLGRAEDQLRTDRRGR
jgi:integrase